MASQVTQEDYGANRLYPLLYILRNVCAPALASLFVQNFKDTKYVKDQKYEEIAKMNLYELLRKVHNKGKKEEEKKKKKQTDNLQSSSAVSKTLHINNLGTNADILSRISVRDLLVERPKQLEIKGDLSNIDVTFLLNVLTNEILEFDLDLRPLQVIRSIRNKIFHSGSEIECTEISLNKLCEAAEKVHKYIGEAVDIHSKREESLSLPQCLDTLACNIIEELKSEVTSKYQNGGRAVLPPITDIGCQSKVDMWKYIEDLVQIPQGQRNPIVMCGASGSGKTSVLQSVVASMCEKKESPFQLVLYLKLYNNPSEMAMWEGMLKSIEEQYPKTVKKYDIIYILDALRMYANDILFLVDWNLKDAKHIPLANMVNGTWVLTYQGECESLSAFQILQVKPLTEDLVQDILKSLNGDEREKQYMLELFDECKYKGILNTPEMVNIFNEIRRSVPCKEMFEYFIRKKIRCFTTDNDLELIEKLTSRNMDTKDLVQEILKSLNGDEREKKDMLKNDLLTEDLIQDILKCLNGDESKRENIFKLFEEPKYKGILNTPEMVNIFIEIRRLVPFKEMLEYFIRKIIRCMKIGNDLKLIEKLTLRNVIENEGFYKEKDLESVKPEITDSFFLKDAKGLSFRYRVIEELFAARFIQREEEEETKRMLEKYPTQIPLLKRVIKFACIFWCEYDLIRKKLYFIKPYLSQVLNVDDIKCYKKRKKEEMDYIFEDDSETGSQENAFTKWSYLVNFVEACGCRQEILNLLGEIIGQKDVWLFKCKFLNEEKIPVLEKILRNVKYSRPKTVRLESGVKCEILNMVWNILGNLPLENKMLVRINIVGRKCPSVSLANLENLIRDIVNVTNPYLQLLNYVGPFVYKGEKEFMECLCVKDHLRFLDVIVRDKASFAESINCKGLAKLIESKVKVNLKSVTENKKTPTVSEGIPPTLTVRYQSGILNLLHEFNCSQYLKYLSMDGIVITEKFHINLEAFTSLECLFIKCNPESYTRNQAVITGTEPMEVDGSEQGDASATVLPFKDWVFKLAMHTKLPKGLERLMLHNMSFCNDSNVSILIEKWKNLQRLMILDTNVSVTGAYDIVKEKENERPEPSFENGADVEQHLKKKCHISTSDISHNKGCNKCPRLTKKERKAQSKEKPLGRELIITSNQDLCRKCKNFPCSCTLMDGEDSRETFDSIKNLIRASYECDYLSFSYTNKIFTVRKNMHKDLRVHIPLPSLDDDLVLKLQLYTSGKSVFEDAQLSHNGADKAVKLLQQLDSLKGVFESLIIVQYIQLELTKLSHKGATKVAQYLIDLKKSYNEPFSLAILTTEHPRSAEAVKFSYTVKFLRDDKNLSYFYFQCSCKKRCLSLKKTHNCDIYINNEILEK
ncbi:uncharacterized protein [Penaeus vannamei]|uniref:uncharacterized protein isoform X1 n=2 Tax=Penaeus vannamei TaxID=6689 RepID=UPI00387F45EA